MPVCIMTPYLQIAVRVPVTGYRIQSPLADIGSGFPVPKVYALRILNGLRLIRRQSPLRLAMVKIAS